MVMLRSRIAGGMLHYFASAAAQHELPWTVNNAVVPYAAENEVVHTGTWIRNENSSHLSSLVA